MVGIIVTSPSLLFIHLIRFIDVSTAFEATARLPTSLDGLDGWRKVIIRDGWKCRLSGYRILLSFSILSILDFLLAFGDAQGNFLAVKVGDTSLACLRLLRVDISAEKRHTAIPTFCRVCC